ncbi:MAG: HD domain-containing protein [Synergistales bacterium]|nr:HD domain-containing protein [Synergistales bacterium]
MNVLVLRGSTSSGNDLEFPAFQHLNAQVSCCVYTDIYRKEFLLEKVDLILLESFPDQKEIKELTGKIRSHGFQKAIFLLEKQGDPVIAQFSEEYDNELMHLVDGSLPANSMIPEVMKEIEKAFIFSHYLDIFSSTGNSLISSIDNPFKLPQSLLLRDRMRYIEAVSRLATLEKINCGENLEHSVRVGVISRLIAERMGLDPVFCNRIELAAPLHDLGMTSLPENILTKTEALTGPEWNDIRTHSVRGWLMLNYCSCPVLEMASEICLTHHERWDGRGYPEGLSANNIPTPGIITTIADSFDVMMSSRPYKKEILFDEAMDDVKRNSRIQFSPVCSYALGGLREELALIYRNTEKNYGINGIDPLQTVFKQR